MKWVLAYLGLSIVSLGFLWHLARNAPMAEDVLPHARLCAWCQRYFSALDRELANDGALLTHGLCDECAAAVGSEIDEL